MGGQDTESEEELPVLQWHPLRGQKLVGLDSISIDGYVYGPDQVKLDLARIPPRFRFLTSTNSESVVVCPARNYEVVVAPREAFSKVATFVLRQDLHVLQAKETFAPMD